MISLEHSHSHILHHSPESVLSTESETAAKSMKQMMMDSWYSNRYSSTLLSVNIWSIQPRFESCYLVLHMRLAGGRWKFFWRCLVDWFLGWMSQYVFYIPFLGNGDRIAFLQFSGIIFFYHTRDLAAFSDSSWTVASDTQLAHFLLVYPTEMADFCSL